MVAHGSKTLGQRPAKLQPGGGLSGHRRGTGSGPRTRSPPAARPDRAANLPTPSGFIAGAAPRGDGSVDYLWSNAQQPPRILNTASERSPWPMPSVPVGRLPAQPAALVDLTVSGSAGDAHVLVARTDAGQQRPQPTVFLVHGGPGTHDADAFSAVRNAWTASGYTAVHVNYVARPATAPSGTTPTSGDLASPSLRTSWPPATPSSPTARPIPTGS